MCKDDEIRFRHMLDAAREAVTFAQGHTRGDLYNDRRLVLVHAEECAVRRVIEGTAGGQRWSSELNRKL